MPFSAKNGAIPYRARARQRGEAAIDTIRSSLRDRRLFATAVALLVVAVAVATGLRPPAGPSPTPSPAPLSSPTAGSTEAPSAAPTLPPTPAPTPSATPTAVPPPPPPVEPFPCGEADPDCQSALVQSQTNIPFTGMLDCGAALGCQLAYDVFWPPDGAGLPTVVMIPGGPLPPGNRSSLWPLARYVAARGAVVFVADYRSSPTYGGGLPRTFADVGCAIAAAAAGTLEHGGSPRFITLVSHSYGGFPGAVLTTDPSPTTIPECTVPETRRPDAYVGIAGVYLPEHLGQDFVTEFVGGEGTGSGSVDQIDAAQLAARSRDPIPVTLLVGSSDLVARPEHAEELAAALERNGYRVTRIQVEGAGHDTILSRLETVDAVAAAALR